MGELEVRLRAILEEELSIYRRILEVARKKTDILKQSDVEALEALTLEERNLVLEIGTLESQREEVIRDLAKELGVSERLDLSSMSQYFSKDGQASFKAIKDGLSELIEELRQVNSLNETLIKDSLQYIDFSLNVMTSASVEGNYSQGRPGSDSLENAPKRNLFDGKA